jgi:hypothetical protein
MNASRLAQMAVVLSRKFEDPEALARGADRVHRRRGSVTETAAMRG